MRIAFVHYHLHPGGVTRILQSTLAALAPHGVEAVILSGEAATQDWPVPVVVVDALGYEERRPACTSAELALRLKTAAREALGAAPDLWHVHNHTLGKNLALPAALRQLAKEGQHLLLQLHDFPEDGRPTLYRRQLDALADGDAGRLSELLYPAAAHIHYATINGRDHATMTAAGTGEQLHTLPNPVTISTQPGNPQDSASRLWLYPTRAIRRKNLGELLLWATLAEPGDRYAATRAPQNPQEQPIYQRWVGLATELDLPIEFDLASRPGADFDALLRSAHALVTTSVAEGFGMAFLEPWLAGRPVCGRDLPEITSEFTEVGIRLDTLYPRLGVPSDWIDPDQLRQRVDEALQRVMGAYGRQPTSDATDRTLAAWTDVDGIDFGRLDEDLQETIVRRLAASPSDRAALHPAQLQVPTDAGTITANRSTIEQHYGLSQYGERLMQVYQQLLAAPTEALQALDGDTVLDAFIAPERLYLLRS